MFLGKMGRGHGYITQQNFCVFRANSSEVCQLQWCTYGKSNIANCVVQWLPCSRSPPGYWIVTPWGLIQNCHSTAICSNVTDSTECDSTVFLVTNATAGVQRVKDQWQASPSGYLLAVLVAGGGICIDSTLGCLVMAIYSESCYIPVSV